MLKINSILFLILPLAAGCIRTPHEPLNPEKEVFSASSQQEGPRFASKKFLSDFEGPEDEVYRLGEGDQIIVSVWSRPELSGKHVIGPDGRITLPLAGPTRLVGLSREEAAKNIQTTLKPYYVHPSVTIEVEHYVSNKVIVLGKVTKPGVIRFETSPTLLEALAQAGSMAFGLEQAPLTSCAVMRGRNKVAWIELQRLFSGGDLSLNIRLKPNDVVYVPDPAQTVVYVLGEVHQPGAYPLFPHMSFLDALAKAGGTTRDAAPYKIHLVRPRKNTDREINLRKMLPKPDMNWALENGDIVYVPTNGLARVGYVLEKLSPGLSTFLIYQAVK